MMNEIIVAPLNWGLGHATRCVPIIRALTEHNFIPVIASDGSALQLLQKEFPKLNSIELPSYNIKYSKNLKWGLVVQALKIFRSVKIEQKIIADYIRENNVAGIISDNRFGARNSTVPSVYITHQLNVLSGATTLMTSTIHQSIIKKFDQCWVPDNSNEPRLSGRLSAIKNGRLKIKFIGALSRFEKFHIREKYDILIILSGPEPQRSLLEKRLLVQLKSSTKRVLLVRGVVSEDEIPKTNKNITLVNFMLTRSLEKAINQSKIVLSRSGYSTILDLAKLQKKAFFIPTPGQFEQEYLAKRMKALEIAPFNSQEKFDLTMLESVKNYDGFVNMRSENLNSDLFELFQSK